MAVLTFSGGVASWLATIYVAMVTPILYDNSYSPNDSNLKYESFFKNHQTLALLAIYVGWLSRGFTAQHFYYFHHTRLISQLPTRMRTTYKYNTHRQEVYISNLKPITHTQSHI